MIFYLPLQSLLVFVNHRFYLLLLYLHRILFRFCSILFCFQYILLLSLSIHCFLIHNVCLIMLYVLMMLSHLLIILLIFHHLARFLSGMTFFLLCSHIFLLLLLCLHNHPVLTTYSMLLYQTQLIFLVLFLYFLFFHLSLLMVLLLHFYYIIYRLHLCLMLYYRILFHLLLL